MFTSQHIFRSRLFYLEHRIRRYCVTKSDGWTSSRVRRTFVDYFSSNGCTMVPSSSVIPFDDRSILYVNAGMNQFKPIFLGTLDPNDSRRKLQLAVNSQKCIRAGGKHNDLDQVGRDGTHHTFFEMLGNWAFNGTMSKKEACRHALDLLTNVYGLEKDRLFVTYFGGDENLKLPADMECREVWRELGFAQNRIIGLGVDENFWEMSAAGGPCGPCTEILYCNSKEPSAAESMEIWNIVFMCYNKSSDGKLTPLPTMHIDTGMGLERLCCILQGVETTYETDLFRPILRELENRTSGPAYGGLFGDRDANEMDTSYRILADHARMFTVTISDGVAPAATRAGNIVRRVIRSAAHRASLMWSKLPRKERKKLALADLCDVVADTLGQAYPELLTELEYTKEVVAQEQAIFEELVRKAKSRLGYILQMRNGPVSASDLFDFHQEYGLPHDILLSVARNKGAQFDQDEFQRKLDDYKIATRVFPTPGAFEADLTNVVNQLKEQRINITNDSLKYHTEKIGPGKYVIPSCQSKIVAITHTDSRIDNVPMDMACTIVLDQTAFYSESGGQRGDQGVVRCASGEYVVDDTYARGGYVFHRGRLVSGQMKCGDVVEAVVDIEKRLGCMQHHTATHLVLSTLERQVGRVRQRSSKLNSDISKLGFWCSRQVTPELIIKLERELNSIIQRDTPVYIGSTDFEIAKKHFYIRRLHGEYYPEIVRIVSIGTPVNQLLDSIEERPDSLVSAELCCGTHLASIGDIGPLRMISVDDGSSGVIKTISFTVGESAKRAETRGEKVREKFELELENIRNNGLDIGKKLTELKERLVAEVIPFELKGHILREITNLNNVYESEKVKIRKRRKEAS